MALKEVEGILTCPKVPAEVPDYVLSAFPPAADAKPETSWFKFLGLANEALNAAGLELSCLAGNEKNRDPVKCFLNRILSIKLEMQQLVFSLFMDRMGKLIVDAKNNGFYEEGITDMAGDVELKHLKDLYKCPRTGAKTQQAVLETDRGVSWEDADEMLKEQQAHASEMKFTDNDSGFYYNGEDNVAQATKVVLVLRQRSSKTESKFKRRSFHTLTPNAGYAPHPLAPQICTRCNSMPRVYTRIYQRTCAYTPTSLRYVYMYIYACNTCIYGCNTRR